MMLLVIGSQNDFASTLTTSSACSRVTFVSSIEIRRAGKSGSKITVNPASFAIVSITVFASFVIFRLMGACESGISSGGFSANLGSLLDDILRREGAAAVRVAAIMSRVF